MINSNNEWDPLKEVIVGNCFNANIPKLDLSFKLFFHDNGHHYYRVQDNNGVVIIRKKYIEELSEDLEGLVNVLKLLGIKVYRPKQLNEVYHIKTPYWETTAVPALNVRDQFIVMGNEVIETSPMIRSRYFENDLVKSILQNQFQNDLNCKWTVMPKPIMTDESFDISYVTNKGSDFKEDYPKVPNEFDIDFEMMIDGAQFVRFNKDILVNIANRNHYLGLEWFKRHFGNKYNFHVMHSVVDNHLDSYVVPLKEGTLLLRDKSVADKLPKFLQSWDHIISPEPTDDMFPTYENDAFINGSKFIDCNVLSIDGDKIIVNSLYPDLIRVLEKNKFTPIPVQHRHRRIFSGGFHCFTLDLNRE
jgi:glycine amidinotransferase